MSQKYDNARARIRRWAKEHPNKGFVLYKESCDNDYSIITYDSYSQNLLYVEAGFIEYVYWDDETQEFHIE